MAIRHHSVTAQPAHGSTMIFGFCIAPDSLLDRCGCAEHCRTHPSRIVCFRVRPRKSFCTPRIVAPCPLQCLQDIRVSAGPSTESAPRRLSPPRFQIETGRSASDSYRRSRQAPPCPASNNRSDCAVALALRTPIPAVIAHQTYQVAAQTILLTPAAAFPLAQKLVGQAHQESYGLCLWQSDSPNHASDSSLRVCPVLGLSALSILPDLALPDFFVMLLRAFLGISFSLPLLRDGLMSVSAWLALELYY